MAKTYLAARLFLSLLLYSERVLLKSTAKALRCVLAGFLSGNS